MHTGFDIKPANASHLDQMVQVHLAAFPGFFLSLMGPRFLRTLYQGFMQQRSGLAYVAIQNGQVLGFVVGTLEPQGFFKALLKARWWAFGLASLAGLLKSPLVVARKIVYALFYRGEALPDYPHAALLSSLGVAPAAQGTGLGKALVLHFNQQVRLAGGNAVYLTTDSVGNMRANQFYNKLGFQLAGTCNRPGGRVLNRYIIDLNQQPTP